MKQIFTLALIALVALSCSKDDGVAAYSISGTPEITSLEAGYKRVVVTWEINTTMDDAALTNIYWDGGESSTGQYLTSDTGNSITIEITDLAEGEYTFYAQNATPTSSKYSAPSPSVTIYVYGDSYCSDLAKRTIASIDYLDGDDIEDGAYVTWSSFTNSDGAIGNMLYYRNQSNVDTEFFCSIDDEKSLVADAIVETEVSYSTLYCPAGCLDTLATGSTSGEEFPMSNDGIIRVASIVAMQPYFAMDDVHVILEKGDYRVTADDINAGLFPNYAEVVSGTTSSSIFLVQGSGSTYDFGGSTVTIETLAYNASGYECFPLHFIGNNNVVKDLTQIDEGVAEAVHPNGITNIAIDGRENRLEGVTVYSTGSYPYRYGEIFGKGGGPIIKHYKHCALLLRGFSNYVLNCNLYHRAYGHCLFMQGAEDPVIEGCYIEGAMTTTEAIWAESGTGSPADNVNFFTTWGYYMSANLKYTIPLCEEGIRTYANGNTYADGTRYPSNGTKNVQVLDCTIKNTRGGINISFGSGTKYIRGCTVIGNSLGFGASSSSAVIEDSYADAQYGIIAGGDGVTADITIIDGSCPDYIEVDGVEYRTSNGTAHIARLGSSGSKVKYRDGRVNDKGTTIYTTAASMTKNAVTFSRFDLGGDSRMIGQIWKSESVTEILDDDGEGTGVYTSANPAETLDDDEQWLTDTKFANETDWPTWMDSNVSGCTIYTNGHLYMEAGSYDNVIYTSGDESSVTEIGTHSNTIHYNYTWDIDTCF